MIKRLCCQPNCNNWAVSGHKLCEKHLAESEERRKKEAYKNAKRNNEGMYNTYRWRMLRSFTIERYPYCTLCGCSGTPDNPLTVDHIQPPEGNEQLFFNMDNLQVLCRNCHNKKTNYECRKRKLEQEIKGDNKNE